MKYQSGDMRKVVDTTIALDTAFTAFLAALTRHQPGLCQDLAMDLDSYRQKLPMYFQNGKWQGIADHLEKWAQILTNPPTPEDADA